MGSDFKLLSKNDEKAALGASLSGVNTVSSIGGATGLNVTNNIQVPSFDGNTQAAIKAALENIQKAETDRVRKLREPLTETEIDEAYAQLCLTERIWDDILVQAVPEDFLGGSVAVNLVFSKDDKAALLTRYFRWDLPSLKHIHLPMQAQFIQEFLIDCYKHPEGSRTQKAFAAMDIWQLTMAEFKGIVLNYIQKAAPQDVRTVIRGAAGSQNTVPLGQSAFMPNIRPNVPRSPVASWPLTQDAWVGAQWPMNSNQLVYTNYPAISDNVTPVSTTDATDNGESWLRTTLNKLGL